MSDKTKRKSEKLKISERNEILLQTLRDMETVTIEYYEQFCAHNC